MKISQLKPNPTATVELVRAGQPTGLFVIVGSEYSPEVKEARNKIKNKRTDFMRRNGGRLPIVTVEEMETEGLSILKAAIQGIEDRSGEGEPMAFTPETVDELLAIDWVKESIASAMGEETLFF